MLKLFFKPAAATPGCWAPRQQKGRREAGLCSRWRNPRPAAL